MATVEWLVGKMPRVVITPEAKEDMDLIVRNGGSDEIGWLGMVTRNGDEFEIDRILLPKQRVHAATTEITPEGLSELMSELLDGGMTAAESSRIRLWGHSHVNMGVSPSGQDNEQMRIFTNNIDESGENPFFVRVIANKKGEYQFSIFLYDIGICLIDAPWSIKRQETGREEFWTSQIKEKVSKIGFDTKDFRKGYGGCNSQYYGYYDYSYDDDNPRSYPYYSTPSYQGKTERLLDGPSNASPTEGNVSEATQRLTHVLNGGNLSKKERKKIRKYRVLDRKSVGMFAHGGIE